MSGVTPVVLALRKLNEVQGSVRRRGAEDPSNAALLEELHAVYQHLVDARAAELKDLEPPDDDELLRLFCQGYDSYEGWKAIWLDGAKKARSG